MSRKVPSHLLAYALLFCVTIIWNMGYASSLPERCLEIVNLDIIEIENYLSNLDLTDVPTVKMMAAGFKCPISALPFGALKSDWSRLLLLQEAQPDEAVTRHKLDQLIRILIIAYYQMEERFDVTRSDAQISEQSPAREMTTAVLSTGNMNTTYILNGTHSSTTEISTNIFLESHPYSPMPFSTNDDRTNDYSKEQSSTARIESMTTQASSSFNAITDNTSLNTRYQYDTLLIDSTTPIEPHYVDIEYKTSTEHPLFKVLDNCLKESIKDIVRQHWNRTYNTIFEKLKNKAKMKHTERSIREHNDINGLHGMNLTISNVSPTRNEFWRYTTYPEKDPLTTSIKAQPYRIQGLNGIETNPQKLRKGVSLNTYIYESFRRFYNADKSNVGVKKSIRGKSDIAIESLKKDN